VHVYNPPQELGYRTNGRLFQDSTEWFWTLQPQGSGTRVVQHYRVRSLPAWADRLLWVATPAHHDRRPGLARDLQSLADVAERANTQIAADANSDRSADDGVTVLVVISSPDLFQFVGPLLNQRSSMTKSSIRRITLHEGFLKVATIFHRSPQLPDGSENPSLLIGSGLDRGDEQRQLHSNAARVRQGNKANSCWPACDRLKDLVGGWRDGVTSLDRPMVRLT
jgi:hypothetical protein